jgi:hypothetical protein
MNNKKERVSDSDEEEKQDAPKGTPPSTKTTIVLCTLGKGETIDWYCSVCCKERKFKMLWQDEQVKRYLCPVCTWCAISIAKEKGNKE